MSIRKNYYELMQQRNALLASAESALNAGNRAEYQSLMNKVKELNPAIDEAQAYLDEQNRYDRTHAPEFSFAENDAAEMGKMLAAGKAVKFRAKDVLKRSGLGRMNAVTLASGSVVKPMGGGAEIRDGFEGTVSALVDQVQAMDLTGMNSYEEPYVVSDMEAQGGKVATTAGTARTAADPTFAKAKLSAYEATVTSYVDHNLSRLNPANYAAKIQEMAMRALRRKVNALIANGDGQSSPDMFGFTNAKNTDGANIFAGVSLGSALSATSLDELVFGYGGNEEVGGNARLYLTKANLKALGQIRGTNEKHRLFRITADTDNPNTGIIEDGGMIVPYAILSSLGDTTLGYLDPANYLLGLFGDYTIRLDESYKAGERLDTILGDVMIGGNLVVHHGAIIGTIGG